MPTVLPYNISYDVCSYCNYYWAQYAIPTCGHLSMCPGCVEKEGRQYQCNINEKKWIWYITSYNTPISGSYTAATNAQAHKPRLPAKRPGAEGAQDCK